MNAGGGTRTSSATDRHRLRRRSAVTGLTPSLAVAMLYGFAAKTEARAVALCISRPSLKAAQLADVIASFYAARAAAVGVPEGQAPADDAPPLAATLSQKADDGTPRYTSSDPPAARHARQRRAHPEHAARAARRQRAHRASPVRPPDWRDCSRSTAPARRLRRSANGSSSPPARFRRAPSTRPSRRDVGAAKKLFAEWPTPIVAVGTEVGDALPYPGREHRERLRVGARASGRRRVPRR